MKHVTQRSTEFEAMSVKGVAPIRFNGQAARARQAPPLSDLIFMMLVAGALYAMFLSNQPLNAALFATLGY